MVTPSHPQKLGKYEILSVLGKGGMGIVYKARDIVIDRVVAVKTIVAGADGIDQSQVARLLQEARSAGRLHHPNIATVFDYGEEGGISYIVLEYAEGVDLGQVISAHQPLPLPAKIDLLTQICHGLGFAHDHGVVHRDLKPANVRLTPQGLVKIVDFGLARFDDTHLTKTGFISGTIAYMSPERMSGETGQSDDIFALGAVAYELLTYQRAFTGASAPEVMFKIMTQTPPPPSTIAELPPQLDRVVLKCLERDPNARYANAYDFSNAVEEVFSSPEVQQFLSSEERSAGFREGVQSWTGKGRRRLTSAGVIEALSSSGRVHAGEIPTAGEVVPPTQVLSASSAAATTVMSSPDATQVLESGTRSLSASQSAMTMVDTAPPTRIMSPQTMADAPGGGAAPTEVMAAPRKRSPMLALGAGAAVLIVGGAIALTLMRSPDEAPPTVTSGTQTTAPATLTTAPSQTIVDATTAPTDDRGRSAASSELQLVSVRLQSKLDAARSVGVALPQQNEERLLSRIAGLQKAAESGDVDTVKNEGKKILADADAMIQRQRRAAATDTGTRTTTRATTTIAETRPAPQPPTPQPQPPTPQPQPPTPQPPAPVPSTPDLRAEVTAFIRRVATAYTNKDADFFREHSLRYTDAMGRAIRNSASTKVRLDIESIAINGDQARVTVQRTDEFGGGTAPATQRLTYVLEKDGGAWKIVRFERP